MLLTYFFVPGATFDMNPYNGYFGLFHPDHIFYNLVFYAWFTGAATMSCFVLSLLYFDPIFVGNVTLLEIIGA